MFYQSKLCVFHIKLCVSDVYNYTNGIIQHRTTGLCFNKSSAPYINEDLKEDHISCLRLPCLKSQRWYNPLASDPTGRGGTLSWLRKTELSRAQGEGDYLRVSPLSLRCHYWLLACFSVMLKRLTADITNEKYMSVWVSALKREEGRHRRAADASHPRSGQCPRQSGQGGQTHTHKITAVEDEEKSPWPIRETWRHAVSGGRRDGRGGGGGRGWETQRVRETGRKKGGSWERAWRLGAKEYESREEERERQDE